MAVLGSELPQKRVMRAVPVRVRAFRALVKINRGIVVNVDVVTGNIIPKNMEMINNNLFHGMNQKYGGHKKHRPLEQETGQQYFL